MKKNFNNIRNDKGFTLVELIVVIAVLGVITVMMIPVFTDYIEKSRRGTDRNTVKELAHAVQVAYTGNGEDRNTDTRLVLTIDPDGNATYTSYPTESVRLDDATRVIIAEEAYVYKSELYRDKSITYSVDETDGTVTISATAVWEDADDALTELQNAVDIAKVDLEDRKTDLAETKAEYDATNGWKNPLKKAQLALEVAAREADVATSKVVYDAAEKALKKGKDAVEEKKNASKPLQEDIEMYD